jgi:arginine/ornithine N-succinyltransferase beta subunit
MEYRIKHSNGSVHGRGLSRTEATHELVWFVNEQGRGSACLQQRVSSKNPWRKVKCMTLVQAEKAAQAAYKVALRRRGKIR